MSVVAVKLGIRGDDGRNVTRFGGSADALASPAGRDRIHDYQGGAS